MDLHLRGKRVLITGASKGIGAAAAEAFAEEGCDLRLAARSGDQLKSLAERLRFTHQIDATVHVVDLRKPEDIAKLVKDASDIDILVNNAGDIPGGSIDKIDEPTWRHAWELKIFGFIQHAGQSRQKILRSGLAFTAGIFTWFIGLALILIALRSAEREAARPTDIRPRWSGLDVRATLG